MSVQEVYICDDCGVESRDEPGKGWKQNIDGDDFCGYCALSLDPPESDNDDTD